MICLPRIKSPMENPLKQMFQSTGTERQRGRRHQHQSETELKEPNSFLDVDDLNGFLTPAHPDAEIIATLPAQPLTQPHPGIWPLSHAEGGGGGGGMHYSIAPILDTNVENRVFDSDVLQLNDPPRRTVVSIQEPAQVEVHAADLPHSEELPEEDSASTLEVYPGEGGDGGVTGRASSVGSSPLGGRYVEEGGGGGAQTVRTVLDPATGAELLLPSSPVVPRQPSPERTVFSMYDTHERVISPWRLPQSARRM